MKERSIMAIIIIVALASTSVGIGIILITPRPTLTIQTTTSMNDTGLLDLIKPTFDVKYLVNMRWVAVGTGQALANVAAGQADVVIVHSATSEYAFINHTNPEQTNAKLGITYAGQGIFRVSFAYNYYVIVGPTTDPLHISGSAIMGNATAIFQKIYTFGHNGTAGTCFASRGDASGTNSKEVSIWKALKYWTSTGANSTYLGWPKNEPQPSPWYKNLGKGMGDTLTYANQQLAYTLTDYGTWLKMRSTSTDLEVVSAKNCTDLKNTYSVIAVDPELHTNANFDLAKKLIYFMATEGQNIIGNYTIDGEQVFNRYVDGSPAICGCGSLLCDVDNGTFYSNLANPNYYPASQPVCDVSCKLSSSIPRQLNT